MPQDVTFYFDFVSPYSYLAFTQLPALVERTNAAFTFKPVHILTIMDKVGNVPTTATCKSKGLYARTDLARWAMQYKTMIKPHPKFGTFSTEPLLLGALAAEGRGQLAAYTKAAFEAIWLNEGDVESGDAIVAWLTTAGVVDAEEIWKNRDDFKAQLEENHQSAISDGVFGVPSFKTSTGLYFGNDRLHFLEAELVA
ncbi:2-hydroxychromene-2-carboxylate isomerase [Roseovarius sp. 2305UL8-3]|uniref:2-hydroxychromene-2-carboxylate isomerase n=1 Tax=Roseovarius conchicola TaxID=3121636 RepID=UPI003529C794